MRGPEKNLALLLVGITLAAITLMALYVWFAPDI